MGRDFSNRLAGIVLNVSNVFVIKNRVCIVKKYGVKYRDKIFELSYQNGEAIWYNYR